MGKSHESQVGKERKWKMKTLVKIFLLLQWIHHFTVNGQVVIPNVAASSPSHVIKNKGSPVCLHWAYSYGGDGGDGSVGTFTWRYKEQVIGFSSTSQLTIQPLARRNGENGSLILEPSLPAPFTGRVNVTSANSTLAINNLQYNDSSYQFGSYVIVEISVGAGFVPNKADLKPNVNIHVQGIPEFILSPPSTLDVNEGSNFALRVEMDGNPKPSADFKWPHLSGSPPTTAPIVQLYPFIYSSTYSLNNIDASYCGRILQTTVKNSIGSTKTKATNVTVLLKMDQPFNIKAEKLSKDRCVEVKWNKAESGACYVKYEVKFKNASGNYLYTETGYNIAEINKCNLPTFVNITEIQLTASFRSTSKTFIIKVSKHDTVVSDDAWKQTAVAFIVISVILVIMIIIIVSIFIVKLRKKPNPNANQETARTETQGEMNYMDLQARSNEAETNNAKLQAEYEEIGKKNPRYANI